MGRGFTVRQHQQTVESREGERGIACEKRSKGIAIVAETGDEVLEDEQRKRAQLGGEETRRRVEERLE